MNYGAEVETVVKDGTKITEIALTDGTKLSAKVFVDASYEGDLMVRAGVKYVVGREAKSEFDEEAAGVRFDKTSRKALTVDADGKFELNNKQPAIFSLGHFGGHLDGHWPCCRNCCGDCSEERNSFSKG